MALKDRARSRVAVERKVYALLEISSFVYRTILPIPVWYCYYMLTSGGEYFAGFYLVFKVIILSYLVFFAGARPRVMHVRVCKQREV